MKKWCIRLLKIFSVLLVMLIVAGVVLDAKYRVLRDAPLVGHDAIDAPSAIRLVANPAKLFDRIDLERLPEDARGLSRYVDPATFIPREATALVGVAPLTKAASVTLFINEKRLGPLFVRRINAGGFLNRLRDVAWEEGMVRERAGVLIARGSLALSPSALYVIHGDAPAAAALPLDGTHLVEGIFDNRNGDAYAVVLALCERAGIDTEEFMNRILLETVRDVERGRVEVDWVTPDKAAVNFTFSARPDAPPDTAAALKNVFEIIEAPLAQTLLSQYGLRLSGTCIIEKDTCRGQYAITNIRGLFPPMWQDALR